MTILANRFFKKVFQASHAASELPRTARAAPDEFFELRALPMEDIWIFRKNLDNSKVVRAVNPRDNLSNLKGLGSAFLCMIMLIGLLLPSAYNLMAGYRIHQLEESKKKLGSEKMALETERAHLLSPHVLAKEADKQRFSPAASDRVIILNPVNLDSHYAMLKDQK